MHTNITRVIAAIAAAAAVSALGVAGASASDTPVQAVRPGGQAGGAGVAPGSQLWVSRYNGPSNRTDEADSIAVSPDGTRVFVSGSSVGITDDFATLAYRAATGTRLWLRRYNGPGNSLDGEAAMVVSPDGKTVFVTGDSQGTTSLADLATVAYRAATGRRLWVRRYNGPASQGDLATSLAVSPDGKRVYVAGSVQTRSGGQYATVAYRAATGAFLWATRYSSRGRAGGIAQAVTVSPDGRRVFVTGVSGGRTTGGDYATVAYRAATGTQLWARRYNGPANSYDAASRIAIDPAGKTVFVTGRSQGTTSQDDFATVAYRAATGTQLWARRYNGAANSGDAANALAVSPDGKTVFAAGSSSQVTTDDNYATIAYNTATGTQRWISLYHGPAGGANEALAMVVGPGGKKVFVTGDSLGDATGTDYGTIAYDSTTGAQLWTARYNGSANLEDNALAIAVSPRAAKVFVTGSSVRAASPKPDFATIAYRSR